MTLTVFIQKLNPNLPLPSYATEHSAGMDLYASIDEDVTLPGGQRCRIPTGIAIALPDNFEAQIRSRSGLAAKNGVVVLNAPGTIDADYRGEIIVILQNHSAVEFVITPGMRIAQMIIAPVTRVIWSEQPSLSSTGRGLQGFGSTGL